jgi:sec-independent protein translocase protein TatC
MMFKYFLELQNRLIYLFTNWVFLCLVSCYYKESLLYFVTKPCLFKILDVVPYFIYTNVTEILVIYLQLIIYLSAYLSFPYFILHAWNFFSPGLNKVEHFHTRLILILSTAMWGISTHLSYAFLIPLTWDYFSKFETNSETNLLGLYLELKLNEYICFLSEIYISSFIIFQSFILILMFMKKSNKNLALIIKTRKFLYLLILIIASILTPPDVTSQVFVAAPVIGACEFFFTYSYYLANIKIIINQGNQLKLIKKAVTKTSQLNDNGKKDFQPKDIN